MAEDDLAMVTLLVVFTLAPRLQHLGGAVGSLSRSRPIQAEDRFLRGQSTPKSKDISLAFSESSLTMNYVERIIPRQVILLDERRKFSFSEIAIYYRQTCIL